MNFNTFNFLCGITGLIIIWLASHSLLAVMGGVVAGIHINYTPK